MFLLYHSKGCNIFEMVLHECYVNDLHTTTCSGMLGHHTAQQRHGYKYVDRPVETLIPHARPDIPPRSGRHCPDPTALVGHHPDPTVVSSLPHPLTITSLLPLADDMVFSGAGLCATDGAPPDGQASASSSSRQAPASSSSRPAVGRRLPRPGRAVVRLLLLVLSSPAPWPDGRAH
jgi:hypothetical protein